jgi:uncharacterized iron-regulated membrane protein
MKLSLLNRRVHYWLSLFVAVPLFVTACTGILMHLRKQIAWVQPTEQKGSSKEPSVSFERVLEACKGRPEVGVNSWADVSRVDVRPPKGILKVTTKTDWEVQIDIKTGEVLQTAIRRSDWINSIHEGAYFSESIKFYWFLPSGVGLVVLTLTGAYLFWQPLGVKWRRKRATPATPRPDRI